MSPEAQRIAIARACGWKNQGEAKGVPALMHRWVRPGDSYVFAPLPDYCGDLNAMHEAEKVLTPDQVWVYTAAIRDVLGVGAGKVVGRISEWEWHATAAQRAEAFLKTLGLWSHGGNGT